VSTGHPKGAAFYLECGTGDQGLGHLTAGLCHHPLKSRAGDAHLVGGIRLVLSFQIGQAQGFQLFIE
jgi:hypothetical protein